MNSIRQYSLASEDSAAWDKTYKLVFTEEGEMFVRLIKQYEQIYKTPDIQDIQSSEFDKFIVSGKQLRELVADKLRAILLPESPSGLCFP